jgi:hypothetical protein
MPPLLELCFNFASLKLCLYFGSVIARQENADLDLGQNRNFFLPGKTKPRFYPVKKT